MQLTTPFNPSKIEQILGNRSLQNERERQDLLRKVVKFPDKYRLQYGNKVSYVSGSLTQLQRFHQNSDIDITIEQINPDDFFAVIGFVFEIVARDVDVIELHKFRFGDPH